MTGDNVWGTTAGCTTADGGKGDADAADVLAEDGADVAAVVVLLNLFFAVAMREDVGD